MSNQNLFIAILSFSDHTEDFKANRMKMHDYITPSGEIVWMIKGYQDSINPQTQSNETRTIQFYLPRTDVVGSRQLHPPLEIPEVMPDSACYYRFEDSPDDEDKEVDTPYQYPCTDGEILFMPPLHEHRMSGIFNFNVKNPPPDNGRFNIRGAFDVYGFDPAVDSRAS
ncbi:hypothetical protein [Pseudomonas corrugata]|uniref:hypothetical protein n=1 Tax=Pseudomonas corrugata TaxID=47879 RepID=UPI0015862F3C|nr:hypothetical protein [Pseudomonas corrugata]MCI0993068.1 hypothetical protein [Pseudomonas corrugata]NUT63994.1 hypothetical protein [Pseudomonas corrugata]